MNLRRTHFAAATSLAAIALAAWWALRPLGVPAFDGAASVASQLPPPPLSDQPLPRRKLAALDLTAFSTPLWVAPPVPPAPPAPAEPPKPLPPLKVQVIAIVRDGGNADKHEEFTVLVYDPDADRLLSLRTGDQIAGRTIARITEISVELRERDRTRVIALSDAGATAIGNGAGSGGGR
ncbi:MAG: hypothetical protein IT438_10800 [Phycisphaerales bacterium]|nr:hypothetical protein [Phycisphaerales bacterium]